METKLIFFDDIKFIKRVDISASDTYLVRYCNIYEDKNDLIMVDNFICELYDDLIPFSNNWDFNKIIKLFFTRNNFQTQISYKKIFNIIFAFSEFENDNVMSNYDKILNISDFELFKSIVKKYSNIKLSDKLVQPKSTTNIVISDDNYNLSSLLMIKIIIQINKNYDYIKKINSDKLELLLLNIIKTNIFLEQILLSNNYPNRLETIIIELINKTQIDFANIKQKEFTFVLAKLLVENNIYNDFNSILNIVYCRSALSFIEMISILKFELLDIDLMMLKKIIYYGRFEAFEKLYHNIPWKILSILEKHNPFDLDVTNCDFDYSDDVNGSSFWGNDEHERKIIGKKQHKELCKMILSIAEEKNYSHISWTDEIKSQWIELVISNDNNKEQLYHSQASLYFVDYTTLIEIFNYKFDPESRESIKNHIKLFGKLNTWKIIKSQCDEKFLDLLLED